MTDEVDLATARSSLGSFIASIHSEGIVCSCSIGTAESEHSIEKWESTAERRDESVAPSFIVRNFD